VANVDPIPGLVALLKIKYLTQALYVEALTHPVGQAMPQADVLIQATAHEAAHITVLQGLIGSGAPAAASSFDFTGGTGNGGAQPFSPFGGSSATDLLTLAKLFEDLSVRTIKLLLQTQFGNSTLFPSLVGMHSVDARHAAVFRLLGGKQALIQNGDLPTATAGANSATQPFFAYLVYGPREFSTTHFASHGQDNRLEYNGWGNVLTPTSIFDVLLPDFSVATQFLGYFAAA